MALGKLGIRGRKGQKRKVSFSCSPTFAGSVVRLSCGFVLLPLQCEVEKCASVKEETTGVKDLADFPLHTVKSGWFGSPERG